MPRVMLGNLNGSLIKCIVSEGSMLKFTYVGKYISAGSIDFDVFDLQDVDIVSVLYDISGSEIALSISGELDKVYIDEDFLTIINSIIANKDIASSILFCCQRELILDGCKVYQYMWAFRQGRITKSMIMRGI